MVIQGNWGLLLAGIWFIITGICTAFSVGHPVLFVLLGILAFFAGVCLVISR